MRGVEFRMAETKTNRPIDLKLSLLVLRCQTGSEVAFRELHESLSQRTLRFLESLVDQATAQDLNQEVWLKVYKQVASLSDTSRFKTWLFQIARNKALDYFRQNKRVQALHELLKLENTDAYNESVKEWDVEISDVLKVSLDRLSPKLREVLALNFFEGMDYDEIALILGCSLGTVKSRIFNAKQKIKELIKTKDYENS